jgi:hypothetical protein
MRCDHLCVLHACHTQVYQRQGGALQLPIGMASAEPWLLDSLDVAALLPALTAGGGGGAARKGALELLNYCQRGARCCEEESSAARPPAGSTWAQNTPPNGHQLLLHTAAHTAAIPLLPWPVLRRRTLATVDSNRSAPRSRGATSSSSRRASEVGGQQQLQCELPALDLPALRTGLAEAEANDLAFLVFAANCPEQGVCVWGGAVCASVAVWLVGLSTPLGLQRGAWQSGIDQGLTTVCACHVRMPLTRRAAVCAERPAGHR